MPAYKFQAIL